MSSLIGTDRFGVLCSSWEDQDHGGHSLSHLIEILDYDETKCTKTVHVVRFDLNGKQSRHIIPTQLICSLESIAYDISRNASMSPTPAERTQSALIFSRLKEWIPYLKKLVDDPSQFKILATAIEVLVRRPHVGSNFKKHCEFSILVMKETDLFLRLGLKPLMKRTIIQIPPLVPPKPNALAFLTPNATHYNLYLNLRDLLGTLGPETGAIELLFYIQDSHTHLAITENFLITLDSFSLNTTDELSRLSCIFESIPFNRSQLHLICQITRNTILQPPPSSTILRAFKKPLKAVERSVRISSGRAQFPIDRFLNCYNAQARLSMMDCEMHIHKDGYEGGKVVCSVGLYTGRLEVGDQMRRARVIPRSGLGGGVLPISNSSFLYVTLDSGSFNRVEGVEVVCKVRLSNGVFVDNCLLIDNRHESLTAYQSVLHLNTSKPQWSETIRVNLNEVPLDSHLFFTFAGLHDESFGFSFLPLSQNVGVTLSNGSHTLTVYRNSSAIPSNYMAQAAGPLILVPIHISVNSIQNISDSKQIPPLESCTFKVSTQLSSTRHTQSASLFQFLKSPFKHEFPLDCEYDVACLASEVLDAFQRWIRCRVGSPFDGGFLRFLEVSSQYKCRFKGIQAGLLVDTLLVYLVSGVISDLELELVLNLILQEQLDGDIQAVLERVCEVKKVPQRVFVNLMKRGVKGLATLCLRDVLESQRLERGEMEEFVRLIVCELVGCKRIGEGALGLVVGLRLIDMIELIGSSDISLEGFEDADVEGLLDVVGSLSTTVCHLYFEALLKSKLSRDSVLIQLARQSKRSLALETLCKETLRGVQVPMEVMVALISEGLCLDGVGGERLEACLVGLFEGVISMDKVSNLDLTSEEMALALRYSELVKQLKGSTESGVIQCLVALIEFKEGPRRVVVDSLKRLLECQIGLENYVEAANVVLHLNSLSVDEYSLKESVVELLEKGLEFERAIDLCIELEAELKGLDLLRVLKKRVNLIESLLKGERPSSAYYLVDLASESYVYRGFYFERIEEFKERLKGLGRVDCITPLYANSTDQRSTNIFKLVRPSKRGSKVEDLWIEDLTIHTLSKLPSISRRVKVLKVSSILISPVEMAIRTVKGKSEELKLALTVVRRSEENGKEWDGKVSTLTRALSGVVEAKVNGGLKVYSDAFLAPSNLGSEKEKAHRDELQVAMIDQVEVIKQCIQTHSQVVSSEMRPLHNQIATTFNRNFINLYLPGARSSILSDGGTTLSVYLGSEGDSRSSSIIDSSDSLLSSVLGVKGAEENDRLKDLGLGRKVSAKSVSWSRRLSFRSID